MNKQRSHMRESIQMYASIMEKKDLYKAKFVPKFQALNTLWYSPLNTSNVYISQKKLPLISFFLLKRSSWQPPTSMADKGQSG